MKHSSNLRGDNEKTLPVGSVGRVKHSSRRDNDLAKVETIVKLEGAKVRHIYQKHSPWDESSKATKVSNIPPFLILAARKCETFVGFKGWPSESVKHSLKNIAQGQRGPKATKVLNIRHFRVSTTQKCKHSPNLGGDQAKV